MLDAYAPTSNGVNSVSAVVMRISFMFTPSASAAICVKIVSAPVPRSVAPHSRLIVPSLFKISAALPQSTPAMPLPCMAQAMPTPRRFTPSPGLPRFSFQPIAAAPRSMQSPKPQLSMTRGSLSPNAAANRSTSPFRIRFFCRKTSGSMFNFAANSSIWLSIAKKPCRAP